MEVNQEKVNEMASQYVNEALATFELFAETPQDMLGEDETEYSVVLVQSPTMTKGETIRKPFNGLAIWLRG